MKILVTGAAGFIGFHTILKLVQAGHEVFGIDNLNDYYDVSLKKARLNESGIEIEKLGLKEVFQSKLYSNYKFAQIDLNDNKKIESLFASDNFEYICHLAAQAGVRYSLTNPKAYIDSNISGTLNILEACRKTKIKHFVYASSSSIYGLNTQMPFSLQQNTDHPVSLYAVSKKANELMAHTYSHLYKISTTGLRFFTVYGPWGRPDMAIFLFTKAIFEGKPLEVYNEGKMQRDFTYIDDIVEGIVKVLISPAKPNLNWIADDPDPRSSEAPYRIYNIGNSYPVRLMDFIKALEIAIGKNAILNYLPMQKGDVVSTWADTSDLATDFGYRPNTPVQEGIQKFVTWYKSFYKL
ncbi:NAD-dependent epimerase [Leptospira kirschneri]|uniref:NAD-dependent epimerase n=1 Tax=Leptospira kirschneri TaxID=29507 RepID=UPI00029857CA|nr:NAD-dependent epimerase [Leptospira kirschneri]EKP04895.1 3-beta hydroxysteroid dehydrogenase/isomerase family protein [Leptospira kirschneri str. 2008720114]